MDDSDMFGLGSCIALLAMIVIGLFLLIVGAKEMAKYEVMEQMRKIECMK